MPFTSFITWFTIYDLISVIQQIFMSTYFSPRYIQSTGDTEERKASGKIPLPSELTFRGVGCEEPMLSLCQTLLSALNTAIHLPPHWASEVGTSNPSLCRQGDGGLRRLRHLPWVTVLFIIPWFKDRSLLMIGLSQWNTSSMKLGTLSILFSGISSASGT